MPGGSRGDGCGTCSGGDEGGGKGGKGGGSGEAGAEAVVATARAIAVGTVAMEGYCGRRWLCRSGRAGDKARIAAIAAGKRTTPPDLDGAGTKSRRRRRGLRRRGGGCGGFGGGSRWRGAAVGIKHTGQPPQLRTHNARASCALRTKPRRWEAVVAVVEAVREADLEVEMVEPAGLRAGVM